MITKRQMLPLLTEVCPSFLPTWKEIEIERRGDEPLVYVELGEFARHVVGLHFAGQTGEMENIFALTERFVTEGDEYVQNAAVVGLLEDIQNIAGNRGLDREVFVSYLKPASAAWWVGLNAFWSGESQAVVISGTDST